MDKLIHKYLSENYYIKTSEAGNDGIYYIFDDRRYPVPICGEKLILEIDTVFNTINSKEYICDWALATKSDVDLAFYWDIINYSLNIRLF